MYEEEGEGGGERGGGHCNNLLQEICLRLAKEDDSELALVLVIILAVKVAGWETFQPSQRNDMSQCFRENGQPGAGGGKAARCGRRPVENRDAPP